MHTLFDAGCCRQQHLDINTVLPLTNNYTQILLRRLLVIMAMLLSTGGMQDSYAQETPLAINPESENFPATILEPEVSRFFTVLQRSSFGGTSIRLSSLSLCQGSCVIGNSEPASGSTLSPAGTDVNEVNGIWSLLDRCDGSADNCSAAVTFTGTAEGSSNVQLVAEYSVSFAVGGGVITRPTYYASELDSTSEVVLPVQTIGISSGIVSSPEGSQVPISVTRSADPCCSGLDALRLTLLVASSSTATEGVDFEFATSAEVSWGAGEVGEKTVLINLLNDTADEAVEKINIEIDGNTLPPQAVVNNRLISIDIQAEVVPGELITEIVSGTDQGLIPGKTGDDLVVRVTGDGVGQPSTFVRITWSVVPEGAATLRDDRSNLGDNGTVSNNIVEIKERGFIQVFATATVEPIDVVQSPLGNTSSSNAGLVDSATTGAPLNLTPRINPPTAPELASNVARFILRSGFFPATGLTENQSNTGSALDKACTALEEADASGVNLSDGQDDLLNTCSELDELVGSDGLGSAINRLMPEEVFAMADSSVEAADIQLTNIVSRINALRSGSTRALDVGGLSFDYRDQHIPGAIFNAALKTLSAADTAGSLVTETRRLGVFVSGRLSVGETDGADNQKSADFSTQGVTLGADYRVSSQVVLGGSIGFSAVDTDFQSDQDSLVVEGLSVALFATWYNQDVAYVDAILQAGNNSYDSLRRINLPGQTGMFANGSTESTISSFTIGAGRQFSRANWEFGPYLRASVTSASVDGYTETAASEGLGEGSVLTIGSHSISSTTLSAGLQVSVSISTSRVVLVPQFWIEGEFETETSKDDINARFVYDPTSSDFTIAGNERDSSYANYGLGTSVFWPGFRSVFAFFESQLGHDFTTQYWLKIGSRFNF